MTIDNEVSHSEDFLEHFGVKGMKWGRIGFKAKSFRRMRRGLGPRRRNDGDGRDTNTDGRRGNRNDADGNGRRDRDRINSKLRGKLPNLGKPSPEGPVMKRLIGGIDAATEVLRKLANKQFVDGYNQSTLKAGRKYTEDMLRFHGDLESGAIDFPAGHKFTRMSHHPEARINDGAYVTYLPTDVAKYTAYWPGDYRLQFKAKGPVKSPSLGVRFSTMADLMDSKPPGGGRTGRQILMDEQRSLKAKAWVKTATAEELGRYAYGVRVGDVWRKSELGRRYMDRMREQGYDVMIDDADSGRNTTAESAMVILNKDKFETAETKKLTKQDKDEAYAEVKAREKKP